MTRERKEENKKRLAEEVAMIGRGESREVKNSKNIKVYRQREIRRDENRGRQSWGII